MSKRNRNKYQPTDSPSVENIPPADNGIPVQNKPHQTPREHRACPICWLEQGGVGRRRWSRAISGRQVKTCYNCDQCGYEWTVVVETVRRIVEVEGRPIQLEHGELPELEER